MEGHVSTSVREWQPNNTQEALRFQCPNGRLALAYRADVEMTSASLGVVNFAHLVENFAHRKVVGTEFHFRRCIGMTRLAGPLLVCALALGGGHANAQAGATPPPEVKETAATHQPTADDVCRTLEEAAAENALPVEFFARVIWQESRFNARAVSAKGAAGIAQFMPQTASWHGLADPFDPIEALRHSASYLRELRDQFGNLGLAAAAYNAGPGRVSAWLTSHRPLPGETRNYVTTVTGRTADEWASPSAAERRRSVNSASYPLHAAGQPDPPSEAGGGAAYCCRHTTLGRLGCCAFAGEQGLGNVP